MESYFKVGLFDTTTILDDGLSSEGCGALRNYTFVVRQERSRIMDL